MSYCLGINTADGLVLASDSRTSSGADQVNICQKMHQFVIPGERIFVILTTGSLSLSQSVITLLRQDFHAGRGLASAENMYEAARVLGDKVRHIAAIDREALEKDSFRFNVHLLLGGQIKGQPHELYMVYPQGNPIRSTPDSPYLQIGESKYGRPILDRGISHHHTTIHQSAKYALLSLEATMRSNATVGPPVDILLYNRDDLRVSHYRRFYSQDPDLIEIHNSWEKALRNAVHQLPDLRFDGGDISPGIEPPIWQGPLEPG
ncbi:peptidase [Prosthecobacter sp.]|uniref:peptidase n=1 Tax=Prosthecobacter sp. TaxID=1965333 RepID=UPI003782EC26